MTEGRRAGPPPSLKAWIRHCHGSYGEVKQDLYSAEESQKGTIRHFPCTNSGEHDIVAILVPWLDIAGYQTACRLIDSDCEFGNGKVSRYSAFPAKLTLAKNSS